MGIGDVSAFSAWIEAESAKNRTPFSYELSRFDILDIDVRDTTRAIVTATFLVHILQGTFESVSSFTLIREQGYWKVPFAESGNFETSWWQKEKNFTMRLQEEGLTEYHSDTLALSFSYPMTWDVNSSPRIDFPNVTNTRGVEIQYVDPSTLRPAAVIRFASLPASDLDSTFAADDGNAKAMHIISTEDISVSVPYLMEGTLTTLRDPRSGRRVLFLAVVDKAAADYALYAETFQIVRKSIQLQNEITY
jgi:hypothetical protein